MGTSVVVMELLGLLDTLGLEEGRYTVEGANESVGFPVGAEETGSAVGDAIGDTEGFPMGRNDGCANGFPDGRSEGYPVGTDDADQEFTGSDSSVRSNSA